MIKIAILVACLGVCALATAGDNCPKINCQDFEFDTVVLCNPESDNLDTKTYCNKGFCWDDPKGTNNKCKKISAAPDPCYGDTTCQRNSICLDSTGLCWKPNYAGGMCSKAQSCVDYLACDLESESCKTSWHVEANDSPNDCGQGVNSFTSYLCEGKAYCTVYPKGICMEEKKTGEACIPLTTPITIDGVEVTKTGQVDYITSGYHLKGVNWNPCGSGLCHLSICAESFKTADGSACAFDRQCVSGICGRDGKCAAFAAQSSTVCTSDSDCVSSQSHVCRCDYNAGTMACVPKWSQGEIEAQKALVDCYNRNDEKDSCWNEIETMKDKMSETDANPCIKNEIV